MGVIISISWQNLHPIYTQTLFKFTRKYPKNFGSLNISPLFKTLQAFIGWRIDCYI